MEHLLLPCGAGVLDSEKAPYIADDYDNGPFLTYAQRTRFQNLHEIVAPSQGYPSYDNPLGKDIVRDMEVFLQTWLVFGLLREVFGHLAAPSDFIDITGSRKRLTTAKLPEIVQQWVDITSNSVQQRENVDLVEHLLACITTAHRILMVLRKRPNITRSILWSTASIAETLEYVVLETFRQGTRSLPTHWEDCYDSDEVSAKMIHNGWCPTDVSKWKLAAGGLQTLYYLSKMTQPKIKDHSNCVGTVCIANQYNMLSQATNHRCSDHACGMLAVDIEAMKSTFDEGHMGLLEISGHEDMSTVTVQVVSSKDNNRYVALSHVWADGLGNAAANALPRCQMAYVGTVVKELERANGKGRLLVWLDTLCCPVDSPKHRQKCLILMAKIYEEAAHVLVLDAQLAHYNKNVIDSVETCARLMFSGWTRRLWTLQEGALSRKLWVQLEDGPVDMDEVERDVSSIYQTRFVHNPLMLILKASLSRLRAFGNFRRREPTIVDVKMALESRSVSVPSDEALCLCTCLRIEQELVVMAPASQRMEAFWTSMSRSSKSLPKSIVFFRGYVFQS